MIIIILSVGLDLASVFTPFYTGNHLRRKMVRATAIELKRQGVTVPDPAKSNSPQDILEGIDTISDADLLVGNPRQKEQKRAPNSKESWKRVNSNLKSTAGTVEKKAAVSTETPDANFNIDLDNIECSLALENTTKDSKTVKDKETKEHEDRLPDVQIVTPGLTETTGNCRKRDSSQISWFMSECPRTLKDFEESKSQTAPQPSDRKKVFPKEFRFDFEF